MKKQNRKQWMLFDGRYRTDSDRATCYECCETVKEARKSARDYGDDTVIVEADVEDGIIKNMRIVN